MRRVVVFVSLLAAISLALAGCGGASRAANHLDAIKQAGVIKIGTSADYPPFESVELKDYLSACAIILAINPNQ